MPTMPVGLVPNTSPGGYSHGGPGGVSRTAVEGGLNRYALSYDRGVQPFNVAIVCDLEQYEVWSLFYHHIIKKGAITFDMPLDSGSGVAQHAANMVPGTYNATHTNGTTVVITFSVEATSKIYDFDAESAELIVDYYNAGLDLLALFDALNQFANIDSNVLDF